MGAVSASVVIGIVNVFLRKWILPDNNEPKIHTCGLRLYMPKVCLRAHDLQFRPSGSPRQQIHGIEILPHTESCSAAINAVFLLQQQ